MYCWKCGTKNDSEGKSCSACSAVLFGAREIEIKAQFPDDNSKSEIVVENNGERRVYHSIDEVPAEIRELLGDMKGLPDLSSLLKRMKDVNTDKPISISYNNSKSFSLDGDETPISINGNLEVLSASMAKKRAPFERPSYEVNSRLPFQAAIGVLLVIVAYFVYFSYFS